jgi:uncharacterized membrane-anchored protein
MFDDSDDRSAQSAGGSWNDGWLKRRERPILMGGVVFQLLVLVGMIAVKAAPLVTGDTVLLRVRPVDPRDMFRGDYVILSYEFSRGAFLGNPGQTVYVPLVPDQDGVHWRADKATPERPRQGKFLRGQVGRGDQLEFGIESFYVQEGKGRQYEDAVRQRRLSAEVAVAADGQATLRSLKIEP